MTTSFPGPFPWLGKRLTYEWKGRISSEVLHSEAHACPFGDDFLPCWMIRLFKTVGVVISFK